MITGTQVVNYNRQAKSDQENTTALTFERDERSDTQLDLTLFAVVAVDKSDNCLLKGGRKCYN